MCDITKQDVKGRMMQGSGGKNVCSISQLTISSLCLSAPSSSFSWGHNLAVDKDEKKQNVTVFFITCFSQVLLLALSNALNMPQVQECLFSKSVGMISPFNCICNQGCILFSGLRKITAFSLFLFKYCCLKRTLGLSKSKQDTDLFCGVFFTSLWLFRCLVLLMDFLKEKKQKLKTKVVHKDLEKDCLNAFILF